MNFISKQPFSIAAAIVAVSAASLIAPQAAQSLTVSSGPLPTTTGINLVNFDSLPEQTVPTSPAAPISLGNGVTLSDGVIGNRNTVITDEFVAPVGGEGNYLKVRQTNATFTFAQSLKSFGLLWGTIDLANTIQFLNSVGTVVNTYTGASLGIPLLDYSNSANLTSPAGTRYVEFSLADIGEDVNQVVLSTNLSPFEVDNVAYQQIPTPALLPGLIGLGVAALRKRKQTKQAKAEL